MYFCNLNDDETRKVPSKNIFMFMHSKFIGRSQRVWDAVSAMSSYTRYVTKVDIYGCKTISHQTIIILDFNSLSKCFSPSLLHLISIGNRMTNASAFRDLWARCYKHDVILHKIQVLYRFVSIATSEFHKEVEISGRKERRFGDIVKMVSRCDRNVVLSYR